MIACVVDLDRYPVVEPGHKLNALAQQLYYGRTA
jgi:hypothetical protein